MRSGNPWLNNNISRTQTHKPPPSKNTTTTYSIRPSTRTPHLTLPSLTKAPIHHTTRRPPTLISTQLHHTQPHTCHNLPLTRHTTPLHLHHHSSIHNNLPLTHLTTLHDPNHHSSIHHITHRYHHSHQHTSTRARGITPHQGLILRG